MSNSIERTDDERIAALFNAIADSIANTPDDEILEDVAASGDDADEIAAEVASVLRRVVADRESAA